MLQRKKSVLAVFMNYSCLTSTPSDAIRLFLSNDLNVWMVRLHMSFVSYPLIKLLITLGAFESLDLTVYPHVLHKILLPTKSFGANGAREKFLLGVNDSVFLQIVFRVKLASARACEILIRVHYHEVNSISHSVREHFAAFGAGVRPGLLAMSFGSVKVLEGGSDKPFAASLAAKGPTVRRLVHVFSPSFQSLECLLALNADTHISNVAEIPVSFQRGRCEVGFATRLARIFKVVRLRVPA